MQISIATVNVNGIRAAFNKGFGDWLAERNPDILLLQETRAEADIIQSYFDDTWHLSSLPSVEKGRAGVAIASKFPIIETRAGLTGYGPEGEPTRDSGRWIEADIETDSGPVTVVSTYFHSATNTPEKAHTMTAKYAHLDKIDARLNELVHLPRPVIVGGDFNIAHHNRDLANWKGNKDSAGFLPQEREYLTRWFSPQKFASQISGDPEKFGTPTQDAAPDDSWRLSLSKSEGNPVETPVPSWTDLGRHHAGDVEGPYTWWSWRGQAFTNDRGWRIDYQAGNPAATKALRHVIVDRQPSYDQRYSDHAPVIAHFEF